MVEDVDDENEFDNEDKAKPAGAAQVSPPLPPVILPVASSMAPRRGSRSRRSGVGNQLHDTYINLNVKKSDEGTALLNVHASAKYKL